MYKNLIGERISVIVSTRGEHMLEYVGTLVSEEGDTIELVNVDVTYFVVAVFDIHKQMFGDNINRGRRLNKVILNKKYIISCNN